MSSMPLAYFIPFRIYGAWQHGREAGSVDKSHNQIDTPFLPPDPERERFERGRMREPPYLLGPERRSVELQTIREVAQHRQWALWACHVRSTPVHLIVTAGAKPEKVMSDFKAYASRRLKECLKEPADC